MDGGPEGRLRRFHISEIKERGYKLDVTWLKDDSLEDADELPEQSALIYLMNSFQIFCAAGCDGQTIAAILSVSE